VLQRQKKEGRKGYWEEERKAKESALDFENLSQVPPGLSNEYMTWVKGTPRGPQTCQAWRTQNKP
jgi:hypothetical protein